MSQRQTIRLRDAPEIYEHFRRVYRSLAMGEGQRWRYSVLSQNSSILLPIGRFFCNHFGCNPKYV
jgi:hypothetical protein